MLSNYGDICGPLKASSKSGCKLTLTQIYSVLVGFAGSMTLPCFKINGSWLRVNKIVSGKNPKSLKFAQKASPKLRQTISLIAAHKKKNPPQRKASWFQLFSGRSNALPNSGLHIEKSRVFKNQRQANCENDNARSRE